MSGKIEFECPLCNKRSMVPAAYAGRRGRCPGCQELIEVPDPGAEGAGGGYDREAYERGPSGGGSGLGPDEKACPMCGETIKSVAKKCKHCGHMLDARLRARSRGGGGSMAGRMARESAMKSEEMPSALDWVLVVLCPGIACILGVVALAQGYTKRGGIMVAVSLAWGTMTAILRQSMNQGPQF
jgi:hypothetical protein